MTFGASSDAVARFAGAEIERAVAEPEARAVLMSFDEGVTKTVPREEAKTRSSPKLYTTTHVRASLEGQVATVAFLEEAFGVKLREASR